MAFSVDGENGTFYVVTSWQPYKNYDLCLSHFSTAFQCGHAAKQFENDNVDEEHFMPFRDKTQYRNLSGLVWT